MTRIAKRVKRWLDLNESLPLRTGQGRSIAQHGELFQGQIEDDNSQRRRCLLSLPCSAMYSRAVFHPDRSGSLRVIPAHKKKACRVVELTLAHLSASGTGGEIIVETTVPEAKGCGSSTADCIAAANAAADAFGRTLSEEDLALLVVEAEVASDNFMFRRAVLFAHREGVALEDYAKCLPKLEILGIDTAPCAHVETLKYPPAEYSWRQLQSFCTLASALRRAVCKQDIRLLGRVATASANINQEFLPKPMFPEIRQLAESCGALGVAVAHSGTVLSILLDPVDEFLEYKVDQLRTGLNELGIRQILRFQT
jgi:Protein involved in propanediol utilization, and related proteins (includes coumermycin biosynthetic protein), possible kinase